jgi:hypothetical protein
MSTSHAAFESLKQQLTQQNETLRNLFGALESLHPSAALSVDPELLQALDSACSAIPTATPSVRVPSGIRA